MDTIRDVLILVASSTVSTVTPVGYGSSYMVVCIALDTPQRLVVLITDEPARCAPTICPLLNSDMSPIMFCGLQYSMYSCAVALLIQPSHILLLLMEFKISEDWPPDI